MPGSSTLQFWSRSAHSLGMPSASLVPEPLRPRERVHSCARRCGPQREAREPRLRMIEGMRRRGFIAEKAVPPSEPVRLWIEVPDSQVAAQIVLDHLETDGDHQGIVEEAHP